MENTTILIVDDELRMRKLIKDFLNKKGYKTIEAKDGEEAIDVFEQNKNKISLIILDVMMPKVDGWTVLRIEAILKRTNGEKKIVRDYGGIIIDENGRTVTVDGKLIELSLREYELLKYLLDNEKIALSRDKILNNVWNYDYYGDSRTIDSHIKKIRHKLGKKGKYIETIRGIGYKFEVK